MMVGEVVVPFSQIWVIGWLSVTNMTLEPAHWEPHVYAAARIAKPSWKSTFFSANSPCHCACIHWSPYTALRPLPEASVNRHMSELRMALVSGMKDDEFQVGSHSHHQCMSLCASLFMLI